MDKCWFVLKQQHYPPPEIPSILSSGPSANADLETNPNLQADSAQLENQKRVADLTRPAQHGAICLGHIIKDLAHLDQVMNFNGPTDYPINMPIYSTAKWDLTWDQKTETSQGGGVETTAPVTSTAAAVELDAKLAFQKSVSNFWEFEALDTVIIQPTSPYIEDSLENDYVQEDIARQTRFMPRWTLYMISGLMIARGSKARLDRNDTKVAQGGIGASVSSAAKATADIALKKLGAITSTFQSSDFIWAVRFTKIHKGLTSLHWTDETLTKGATFAAQDSSETIQTLLAPDGIQVINDTSTLDVSFVFLVPLSLET